MNDDSKEDNTVPKRCQKEQGRDLCLYSSTEFPSKQNNDSLTNNRDLNDVKKKYYTNMYTITKWSLFLREIYHNQTLDKFCNKLDDGTYILGIPSTSKAIEHVLLAINLENDEIINPKQGSVSWVNFNNVIEALDIANYLQIQDLLDRCGSVIESSFPEYIGSETTNHRFNMSKYNNSNGITTEWRVDIKTVNGWKLNKKTALSIARYLLVLMNYFQNRTFSWSKETFKNKKYIHSLLLAFLYIDLDLISIDNKMEMFNKYVKEGDYAYTLFIKMAFMTFGKNGPKKID